MGLKSDIRGKKYSPEDFKNLVISLLEKAAESGAQLPKKDPINEIRVCEQEILSDYTGRREEVVFEFYRSLHHQADVRKLIEAVKEEKMYRVLVGAKVLKMLGEFEYIVKLFDKLYFANTDYELFSYEIGKVRYFRVVDTGYRYAPPVRFYEISQDEALLLLL